MTTNAEYVAPHAEEFKLNFQTEAYSYKAKHDINKSRENMHCKSFCLFCVLL